MAPPEPGWTFDTFGTYVDSLVARLVSRMDERDKTVDLAVALAQAATEKRFDSVNEFRKTLSDQATGFVVRTEYQVQHDALALRLADHITRDDARFAELSRRMDISAGAATGMEANRGRTAALLGSAMGVIGTLVAVVTLILYFRG